MGDPEGLLGALPEESPPPEIVLAAVRVFRYRFLAVAAIAIAVVVAGAFLVQQINVNGQFPVKVATARVQGGQYSGKGVGRIQTVDHMSIVVWEVVGSGGPNPDVFYVHVVGWDPKARDVFIEVNRATWGGYPVSLTEQDVGGSRYGPTTLFDVWFGVEIPPPGTTQVSGPLEFDASIVRLRGERTVATVPFELEV